MVHGMPLAFAVVVCLDVGYGSTICFVQSSVATTSLFGWSVERQSSLSLAIFVLAGTTTTSKRSIGTLVGIGMTMTATGCYYHSKFFPWTSIRRLDTEPLNLHHFLAIATNFVR
jgi:hypothetical protein